jgi:Uncharacterized alpha/beta hydrolase domain (DUF2235)
MPVQWTLIFSDGTGQRGVREDASGKSSNIYRLYVAAQKQPDSLDPFYDAGIGTPEEGRMGNLGSQSCQEGNGAWHYGQHCPMLSGYF